MISTFKHKTKMLLGAAVAAWALCPLGASAQQYLTENFDYPVGGLNGNGAWVAYGSSTKEPIQVVDAPLAYEGYQAEGTGKAVKMVSTSAAADSWAPFADAAVTSGAVYLSTLINVSADGGGAVYFLNFAQPTTNGLFDGKSGGEYGRIYYIPSTEGKYKLGVSRYNKTYEATTEEYENGKTYLVVFKYEFVDGTTNDIVSLWVNPTDFTTEPTPLVQSDASNIGGDPTRGLQAVELRQAGASSAAAPELTLSALRVAGSWSELFGGGVTPPVTTPKISPSATTLKQDVAFVGETYTLNLNVKGSDLTGDITVGGLTTGKVTASATTISKDDAESDAGYDLTLTLAPTDETITADTLVLSSEGAANVKVPVKWLPVAVTDVKTLFSLRSKDPEAYTYFRYTGNATVSFVDAVNKNIYMQDATAGTYIACADYNNVDVTKVKVGDKLTNVYFQVNKSLNIFYMTPLVEDFYTVVSSGNTITPEVYTLSDLKDYPTKANMLVTVKNVSFSNVEDGATFSTSGLDISDATGTGRTKHFAGTNLIGTAIPTDNVTLTGIATSASAAVIGLRSLDDIQAVAPEPSLTVEKEQVFHGEAAPMGQKTEVARLTVTTTALADPVQVYLTGANAAEFSLSQDSIPAGDQEVVISLYYEPTAIGKHNVRVNFESTLSALNTGVSATMLGYDPENLPTFTVSAESLDFGKVDAATPAELTLTVTTANFPDYPTAIIEGLMPGVFTTSSSLLLKNGENTIKVTCNTTKSTVLEDEALLEHINLSGIMAKDTVTLTGTMGLPAGSAAREGDKLPLSDVTAYTQLQETFDGVTKNQPLAITDWRNIAQKGTRAWWGYELDGQKMAKVTPYDSKVETGEGTPCAMELFTPPLDNINAANHNFTFRLMGQYLQQGQTDTLTLCAHYYEDGQLKSMYLDGCNFPCTADDNNTWYDYNIDLSQLTLPDVFYISFFFESTRGADNSATYYLDDVTYGINTTGINAVERTRSLDPQAPMYNTAGQAVGRAYRGMVIQNGRKYMVK